MKALRFHAARDLRIEDVAAPDRKPPPGQVLVRNRFVGICGTDLHEYAYGPIFIPTTPHPFTGAQGPQILGHEFGGVVTAIGEGVSSVKPGDRVSVQPLIMPRAGDYYADRGLFHLSPQLALAGLSWAWGGMAEEAMLHEYNVQRIPDALSDEEAALVEPAAVAVYSCDRGGVGAGSASGTGSTFSAVGIWLSNSSSPEFSHQYRPTGTATASSRPNNSRMSQGDDSQDRGSGGSARRTVTGSVGGPSMRDSSDSGSSPSSLA